MKSKMGLGVALGGLFLAAGVGFAAVTLGQSLIEMRRAERVVTVKGLAETSVISDVGSFSVPFYVREKTRKAAIDRVRADQQTVAAFFREKGIEDSEITIGGLSLRVSEETKRISDQEYKEETWYYGDGSISIRSDDVSRIAMAADAAQELWDRGVSIEGSISAPRYSFTRINEVKPGLIAEATKGARSAAERFAEDSGSNLGGIASANQGVVQFLTLDGDNGADYDREKKIRVVSTVKYYLVD